jgi:hypothetical protein
MQCGACLDFFERDDGGTTAADIGAGELVEVDKGYGSERDGDWMESLGNSGDAILCGYFARGTKLQ